MVTTFLCYRGEQETTKGIRTCPVVCGAVLALSTAYVTPELPVPCPQTAYERHSDNLHSKQGFSRKQH
jgi:hypothetical protein